MTTPGPAASDPTRDGGAGQVHAAGERSAAVGRDVYGSILTGDNSRVVQLPAEAFVPMAEIEARAGIDNIPARPGEFVGRDDELNKLTTVFAGAGPVVVAAVHGLGGIGKSTLVAHWAATHPHGFAPIVWITADTDTNLTAGLAAFANRLQPALAQVLEVEQLADRALQWLATHTEWLLVLDNADDLKLITPVLARAGTGGRVVVTSRRASGWAPGTPIMRLDVLEPEESLQLLTALLTTNGPRDTDGAAELCAELGHLPLAIEQAGAYLAQDPFLTPRGYLQLLAEYPAETFGQADVDTDSERTIARIWRITLNRTDQIEPAAVDLLRTLAWYAPDAIPLSLCDAMGLEPPKRSKALGVLATYNMITPDLTTSTLSIHRLVQAVTRTPDPELTDPHRHPEKITAARTHATETLYATLPDHQDPGTWPTWRALLPHIDALTGLTTSDNGRDLTTPTIAAIRNITGLFLSDQGLHTNALTHLKKALADREQTIGPDHPDTLNSRNNLASAYKLAGQIAEAIPLFAATLTDRERTVGPDHPNTLTARNNLAYAYESAGRVAEAIPLFEATLIDLERIIGPDHPNTLAARNNLASTYDTAGRTTEAITLHERTLTDRERILGPHHPDTLTSRGNLAGAYQEAGRLAEAIPLLEQTLTDRERILGPDHPNTLISRSHLASTYRSVGRLAEAIPLFEATLTDRERILGPDHPDTLKSRNNLAYVRVSAGRFTEAILLFEAALTDRERALGADHPDTLIIRNNLASTYHSAGRLAEAIALLEQTLTDRERVLGLEHPDTLISRNNLAGAYQEAGRLTEAIALLEQTLTDRERILGPDHLATITSRYNLADTYSSTGRFAEAIPLFAATLTAQERILGTDHPDTLDSRIKLAYANYSTGQVAEAILLLEQTLTAQERILGTDHPDTLSSRHNLASAYETAGRLAEAISLYEGTLTDRERILGPGHPDTRLTRGNLTTAQKRGLSARPAATSNPSSWQ
ncbi:FxSxx-COOH system tetratricopeptide repeat protein [Nocardia sp. NPDC050697]|uniref:FxSxx-COOH system tetratricopeptide repeat protein n=1 Tax=Nocardia sp. NPDC050697 TaxID=3155158 RepID=UPI0033C95FFE